MKIYTSYYDNHIRLREAGIIIVGITYRLPQGICDAKLKAMNAPKEFYKYTDKLPYYDQEIEEFTKAYQTDILGPRTQQEVIETFTDISKKLWKGADIAFCSYEKPGEFSHRHILAEWLNEYIQNKQDFVKEYVNPKVRFKLNEALDNL
jgi:hypothetical protein